jgi:HK97 family phage major capsid protein
MKNIRLIVFALLAVCALVAGLQLGFDSTSFAFNALMALGVAVAPLFKRNGDLSLYACETDPVALVKTLADDLRTARTELTKQQGELKDAHAEVMKSITTGVKLDKETQDNIDKAIATANDQATIVKDVAQKLEDIQKSVDAQKTIPFLSAGGQILKQLEGNLKESLAKLRDREQGKLVIKDVINSGSVSTGMKREPYIDSLVSMERQPLRLISLLTTIPVQTDSVKFGKQTLRTNAARIVAEGTPKPYSEYKWENDTAIIEVLAHLSKLSLQALADAPRLAAEVEAEMEFGLALAEEWEVINGDGSTGHLSGLIHNATAYAIPAGMDTDGVLTPVDRLRVAMLQIHLAYAVPDGHVLNPINMAEIDLQRRDPDGSGGYLYSAPDENTGVSRLWRLPTVETPTIAVDKFLTGAFKYSAHLYRRQGSTVQISTENDKDFENNEATMRCESRLGLGVRRPYGIVYGDLKSGGS